MEAADAVAQLGGAASYSALLGLTTRRRLRTALARGDVVRLGRGRYTLAAVGEAQRLAERLDARVSHLSAAAHYGWETRGASPDPQLIVPSNRPVPRPGRARIRVYDARDDELWGWTTSPVTTVLLCARDLDPAAALCVADSALRHRDVTEEELAEAARTWPPHVQALVAQANGRAANPFESVLRSVLLGMGLDLVPQFEVGVGGSVFHPDLVDPIDGVVVEADSWTFHAGKEEHERDCRRYSLLVADGWRVLRFSYDHVMYQADFVRRCLAMAYGHERCDTPGDTRRAARVAGHVA